MRARDASYLRLSRPISVSRPRPGRRRRALERPAHTTRSRDVLAKVRRAPRTLVIGLGIAVIGAAVAGIASYREEHFPIPPEQLVTVYRQHGCHCVFPWIKTLEAEGFVVRTFEPESLRPERFALRTPTGFSGCHVARFMGYFIEGHVPGNALHEIARQHPRARGFALASDISTAVEGLETKPSTNSVILFDAQAVAHAWVSADETTTTPIAVCGTEPEALSHIQQ